MGGAVLVKEQLTFWAKVWCRWLGYHWLDPSKGWSYKGKIYGPCKLCGRVIGQGKWGKPRD